MSGTLRRILNYPARLRRTKGFGVHSPFAYEFITEVVRPPKGYDYYAYDKIERVCRLYSGKREVRYAKLLFRLLCRYNPAEVDCQGKLSVGISTALEEAARFRRYQTGAFIKRALIMEPSQVSADIQQTSKWVHGCLAEGECIVVATQMSSHDYQLRLWESVAASSYPGMGFTDGNIGIFVAHSGLPHLIFDVVI